MKQYQAITFSSLSIILMFTFLSTQCRRELPSVETLPVDGSDVTTTSAIVKGTVIDNGGDAVIGRGICYGTAVNPTVKKEASTGGMGDFAVTLIGLNPDKKYYVRAYAENGEGTSYGENEDFYTKKETVKPEVQTVSVDEVTKTSAVVQGNVVSDGGAAVTARGVCWSTSNDPTISDDYTTDGIGTGSFTSSISDLSAGTIYYVRAYATNTAGTEYGNELSFTTEDDKPTVTTASVSNITDNSALSGGNVTSDGGAAVTARGVCWSTSQNPTVADNHTTDGSGTGTYTSSITSLSPNTTYYVRAYATNSEGTAYGNELPFTTGKNMPTVTTTSVSNITESSASSGGNVTSDGGAAVTARGVCWSTSQNPTISDNHTTDGSGTGSYASSISGLATSTTYYVRAYATNSEGTAYGTQLPFTTGATIPTLTTTPPGNITENSASSGGTINSDGGAAITARGVCWSTSQDPSITDNHTTDGSGTGSFTSSISNLSSNTSYYVRAYATNSVGTAYGSSIPFTTLCETPSATTNTASNVGSTTATLRGEVNANGASTTVTFEYGTSTSYGSTIAATPGTVTGRSNTSVTASLSVLMPNTRYYYRIVATSCGGTTNGSPQEFTTEGLPVLTTLPVTNLTPYSATSGGEITDDGGYAITARGVCWNTSGSPGITDYTTADGSGTGTYSSDLTGLFASTRYYVRAYATNSVGTSYGQEIEFDSDPTTITDIEGNEYPVVRIGDQLWMTENLATTQYNDGADIPLETDNANWAALSTPAYCWYLNTPPSQVPYGAKYNWYVVETDRLCPSGWHVPSDLEWLTLEIYLQNNDFNYDGTIDTDNDRSTHNKTAKSLGSHNYGFWASSPNEGSPGNSDYPEYRNKSGFNAYAGGGRRGSDGEFALVTYTGFWWTSTDATSSEAVSRLILNYRSDVWRQNYPKNNGHSVRCIRDY